MRFSVTYISTLLLCASGGTHARLGSIRTLSSLNASEPVADCADGYTCWEDENGNLWAKYDGEAGGMDCNNVCFAAFAGSSAFHTCKQGVPAPKTVNGLSGVAAGLNFDCSGNPEYPNQCWGGKSPPTLNGTILISAGDQVSKNCYLPSESPLSCNQEVDGANCYGELFSSVCPCEAQEESPITESKKWRLYTHGDYPKAEATLGWQWDLDEIYFYSSPNCTGLPLNVLDGTTFSDSGNAGDWWTPDRAFGLNNNKWGGRWDNNIDKNLWIAIEFPSVTNVGCVQFDQFNNYARYMQLEAVPAGSTTWETVKELSDGHVGTNTIQV